MVHVFVLIMTCFFTSWYHANQKSRYDPDMWFNIDVEIDTYFYLDNAVEEVIGSMEDPTTYDYDKLNEESLTRPFEIFMVIKFLLIGCLMSSILAFVFSLMYVNKKYVGFFCYGAIAFSILTSIMGFIIFLYFTTARLFEEVDSFIISNAIIGEESTFTLNAEPGFAWYIILFAAMISMVSAVFTFLSIESKKAV